MDRLDALRIFAQVADMGSYTQAATALRMPKATVSIAVQKLEASLGARLLHRTTRVVRLTYEGEQLYARCRTVLSDYDELAGLFRTTSAALSGRVRIDMTAGLARWFFIPRLPKFVAMYPNIEVELSATDRFVDALREGVDLVIRVGPLPDSSLTVRAIGMMELSNAASPEYLRRFGVPTSLDDLEDHVAIAYPEHATFSWQDGTREMRSQVTVDNTDSYIVAALSGLGIIQSPSCALQKHFASGALVEILPGHRAPPLAVSILHAQGRKLSRRARALLDFIEPELKREISG
ncbi:MAG TPA: LysR family transcriptional regulator [Kofleriaceae bacterium]